MIKIERDWVGGIEGAVRGMRNPFESNAKSDSVDCRGCELFDVDKYSCAQHGMPCPYGHYLIGEADIALCKKLIRAGSEHRKFLRMIHVQADVVAPRYWWAEMDKYKFVEANSSSTMHLITKKYLSGHDFSIDNPDKPSPPMQGIIDHINRMIEEYNSDRWSDEEKQTFFMVIKECLPESYNQLRTIDTNYECLLNIYHQRHAHRLPEWREFCDWCLRLPYMEEFINA